MRSRKNVGLEYSDVMKQFHADMEAGDLGGCRKLSMKMLEKMGRAGVSKMEFNTVIYLARCQDSAGKAYCNVHMLISGIGLSDSYFPGVLYSLRDKGLISFKRTSEWRRNKNGVYEVTLLYNSFEGDYKNKKYIRLGHGIFQSQKFFDMTVMEKYVVLMAMYEMRSLSGIELERTGNGAIALSYWSLFNKCLAWSGYSRRTVLDAIHKLKTAYKGKIKVNYKEKGKPMYQSLLLSFPKTDLLFADTDDYARYNNLVNAAFEEEGIHLSELMGRQGSKGHAADFVIRHEGKVKEAVRAAAESFKKGLLILDGQSVSRNGLGTVKEANDIRRVSQAFSAIVKKAILPARKFGTPDGTGPVCRWDCRPTGNYFLKDVKRPLWFRYLISEAISGFRWMSGIASFKDIRHDRINIRASVPEFMQMLLSGVAVSFGHAVKKISLSGVPAA